MEILQWDAISCAISFFLPAKVAQLDACPTGDHEVAGSIPAGSGNILSCRLIMEYFYGNYLPFADSRRAVVSFMVCLFVLRFYGPVNPMGSCRARSVYLTTRLLGRLSPLSG